jgi:hypothetical protein
MKKNYSQEIFIIAILSLTVASVWVYLSVHRALNKSEKPVVSQKEIRLLDPQLDNEVFEELKSRNN